MKTSCKRLETTNGIRSMTLDSSKIETNLCVLPTTYINNKCQLDVGNVRTSRNNDTLDKPKTPKPYCNRNNNNHHSSKMMSTTTAPSYNNETYRRSFEMDSITPNESQPPTTKKQETLNRKKVNDRAVKVASIKNRHKLSSIKLRRVRNKIAHSVSSDSNLSDSDSEYSSSGSRSEEEESESLMIIHNESLHRIQQSVNLNISKAKTNKKTNNTSAQFISPVDLDIKLYDKWPIRPSLFPNIPPYIAFVAHDHQPLKIPQELARYFKWRLSTTTPVVVRKVLTNTGFKLVRKSNEWMGCWGKHMKSVCFQSLRENQKLNHFPGTFQIGRKDRLWKNLQRLMLKYGNKEFGFIPRTYVLPHDLKLLRHAWEKTGHERWIIKPPAAARGTGIRVIHRWAHLPKKKALVVQQYISNPYLINGSKFDLRLYVLVTSFNPLRIYLYPEGLARFASMKYSDDLNSLNDRYMHLTNYSINKLSSHYTTNEDANACKGHKWTLSKLWEYLEKDGINTKLLWRSLKQLVIKTMLCAESSINQLYEENINSRYNCYELFGVDVLLDERLKAWLLEVNISPSLHSTSPLDLHVKGPLVQNLLNIAQFHLPDKLKRTTNNSKISTPPCLNTDIYTTQITAKERLKHTRFEEYEQRDQYITDILKDLTGDDVRHLTQAEDEIRVLGNFERLFPTQHTHIYFKFMDVRYYNRLFDAWETKYKENRIPGIKLLQSLCDRKVHLVIPPSPVTKNIPSEKDQITTKAMTEVEDSILMKIPVTITNTIQPQPDTDLKL